MKRGRSPLVLTEDAVERALDPRSTDALLAGIPHVAPGDRGSDWWKSPRYYPFYAGLGRLVKPRAVLEVGVRFGYSLISMWRGHPGIRRITGVDAELYIPGSQRKALENLAAVGCGAEVVLLTLPSAKAPVDAGAYDLVHIDGDHSFAGARDDVRRFWEALAPGGVMVVDDTAFYPEVRAAMESLQDALTALKARFFFSTFRGCWIGLKGAARRRRAQRPKG